jgi:hypothetical protein
MGTGGGPYGVLVRSQAARHAGACGTPAPSRREGAEGWRTCAGRRSDVGWSGRATTPPDSCSHVAPPFAPCQGSTRVADDAAVDDLGHRHRRCNDRHRDGRRPRAGTGAREHPRPQQRTGHPPTRHHPRRARQPGRHPQRDDRERARVAGDQPRDAPGRARRHHHRERHHHRRRAPGRGQRRRLWPQLPAPHRRRGHRRQGEVRHSRARGDARAPPSPPFGPGGRRGSRTRIASTSGTGSPRCATPAPGVGSS